MVDGRVDPLLVHVEGVLARRVAEVSAVRTARWLYARAQALARERQRREARAHGAREGSEALAQHLLGLKRKLRARHRAEGVS